MTAAPATVVQPEHRPGRARDVTFRELLFEQSGGVHEVRIKPTSHGKRIDAGWFDDPAALHGVLEQWDRLAQIYVTLNPTEPGLLARSNNRLRSWASRTTGDAEIARRLWLYLDLDPVRPAGIPSTRPELKAALACGLRIRDTLTERGWPLPVLASSGNGTALLYRIDLPNDDASTRLVQAALEGIGLAAGAAWVEVDRRPCLRFVGDPAVDLDLTVFNASRVVRMFGTVNCKGDGTDERPRRRSQLLEVPEPLEVVSTDALRAIAWTEDEEATAAPSSVNPHGWSRDGVERFIAEAGLAVHKHKVDPAGRDVWVLACCPFDPGHTDASAAITREPAGKLGFRCHHDGCAGRGWRELRDRLDPDRTWAAADPAEDDADDTDAGASEPAQPFPTDVLPDALQRLADEVAANVQVDPGVVVPHLLALGSAAIGNSLIAAAGSMRVQPALHFITALRSGEGKSTVRRHLDPLSRPIAQEVEQRRRDAARAGAQQLEQHKIRSEAWRKHARQAADQGDTLDELPPDEPEPSGTNETWIFSEGTLEGIVDALSDSPKGVLWSTTEGHEALCGLGRYADDGAAGRSLDAARLRKLLDGEDVEMLRAKGVRRIARHPFTAMDIDVQPALLESLFKKEDGVSGLRARFLIAAPRSTAGSRRYEGLPDRLGSAVMDRAAGLIDFLWKLPLDIDEEDGRPLPREVPLDDGAAPVWLAFCNELEDAYVAVPEEETGFLGHLRGHVLRLACVLQALDDGLDGRAPTGIGADAMTRAARLAHWYLDEHLRLAWEARREAEQREADDLRERVRSWCRRQRARGKASFTVRDLVRNSSRAFRKPGGTKAAREVLQLLVREGFLEELAAEDEGKPRYRVAGPDDW